MQKGYRKSEDLLYYYMEKCRALEKENNYLSRKCHFFARMIIKYFKGDIK